MQHSGRYDRNRNAISPGEQNVLAGKKVFVAGCGGLGGYIIEMLARSGVGFITAADPDVFDETNLNRQILCTEALLGSSKALAAAERVRAVNSSVAVNPLQMAVDASNCGALLEGHDLVVDALDSVASRFVLEEGAGKGAIPLVHGAIAGWFGQVAVIYPGDRFFEKLYPRGDKTAVDTSQGNPSFSPAVIAGLQVAESLKILLGREPSCRNKLLFLDMMTMDSRFLDL